MIKYDENKKSLIQKIFIAMKASNTYISGELFLKLAFMDKNQLIKICQNCHIQIKMEV